MRSPLIASCLAAFALAASAHAAKIRVADCVRDSRLDYWAKADSDYCVAVMSNVFESLGIDTERASYGEYGMLDSYGSDVICSAFRTEALLENYDFPLQAIGRMHFALYATPKCAASMMSMKITDWPRLKVGYSPVSQGQCMDRQNYFSHARLDPEYVEYRTSAGAVKALGDGDIDVLFLYTPFGRRPKGVVEIVPIGDRNVYFAVRKDNRELFDKLVRGYRDFYIDHIDVVDQLRKDILGVPKPSKRVRVAAYARGDMFGVTPDGDMSGALLSWMNTVCDHTHWTLDYVYGDYDESLSDVESGRLDLVGGIGFSPDRRDKFLFPHTPIGMLRVFLWTHPGSPYKPGDPSTWNGMRLGILSGTVSGERAKRQFGENKTVEIFEFSRDSKMLEAYFGGEIDACIDVEMPRLANEEALHVYTAHPMYICTSPKRMDIFDELEAALEAVCEDPPKFQRMISEHHYGHHSEMTVMSLKETEWLARRRHNPAPIMVDFSPWPFPIRDKDGDVTGLPKLLLDELSRSTGLKFDAKPLTGVQTAEAKFMRGETDIWIPYPSSGGSAVYAATSIYSQSVPRLVARDYGAADPMQEFELFARRGLSSELASILRKAIADVDQAQLSEMFMADGASRRVVHRVFGMTGVELRTLFIRISALVLCAVALYGLLMGLLLKRQADRANKAAQVAEGHAQAKTRFLAMMSHELRTPLNAVIGFAEFLSRQDTDEKRRKEYTDGILVSSNALLGLINDILDLSKLEAGSMDMRVGTCDIDQLMREIPAIFGYRVRKHGVELVMDLPKSGTIPLLALSQEGMRQILLNLVGNAAKFTEKGRILVKVEWRAESRTLHVEVRDTGPGISKEKMDRMFDPFIQDIGMRMKQNTGEVKGTGLGLPIVKRLIDAAGGTITAESEIGVGSVFVIDLPDLAVIERGKAAKADGADGRMLLPRRVLVVDDMAMNRRILGIHLQNMKVEDVRFAENGVEALKVMESWRPDLVLTDMWMPEMDGTQLVEAMHRDGRLSDVPVIAVTADIDVDTTYDMSLFTKVMAKPVTAAKLQSLFGEVG